MGIWWQWESFTIALWHKFNNSASNLCYNHLWLALVQLACHGKGRPSSTSHLLHMMVLGIACINIVPIASYMTYGSKGENHICLPQSCAPPQVPQKQWHWSTAIPRAHKYNQKMPKLQFIVYFPAIYAISVRWQQTPMILLILPIVSGSTHTTKKTQHWPPYLIGNVLLDSPIIRAVMSNEPSWLCGTGGHSEIPEPLSHFVLISMLSV